MQVRRFQVTGRVQGVGFRWWTRGVAEELGLIGSVRNMPDGSVEVRAGGSPEALMRLEAELRRGPATSRVEEVRVEEGRAGEEKGPGAEWAEWKDFSIER